MNITVTAQTSGLSRGPEVWVRVLSDEVLDWPRVQQKLDKEQMDLLATLRDRKLLSYYPHLVTPGEREEHGYQFEEWFVWGEAVARKVGGGR